MFRKYLSIFYLLLALLPLAADTERMTVTIGVPTAPPALPVLHIIDEGLLDEYADIELDIWTAPEQLIAMVQDRNHDMFAFPLTVIATLYNRGVPVRLMNVNTWGVTYFLTTDPDFTTWADLENKTVYIPLRSSPPDALTLYFLAEAGLTPGRNVNIIYASTSEVAQLLASGKAEYATLIEPQVTTAMMKNSNVRRALSFEEEWQRVTGTETRIPNAGFGTKESFIKENPEFIAAFQQAYKESLKWVLENPDEAGMLAEEYLGMNAAIATKAIPNMGLHFETAEEAKAQLDVFYNLLYSHDPSMIGGSIPDKGMYYEDPQQ